MGRAMRYITCLTRTRGAITRRSWHLGAGWLRSHLVTTGEKYQQGRIPPPFIFGSDPARMGIIMGCGAWA